MSLPQSVTLRLTDSEGNIIHEVLPGPGGTIRFAVGEPNRRSGVWRIWAPSNKSDVYIGIRTILGYQKWSLHESGDWRHQWVTEARAEEFTGRSDRTIDRWQQPAEVGATGWTRGFTIRVRHRDLVAVADAGTGIPTDTLWLPSPPEGRTAVAQVVIARPDQVEVTMRGMMPFAGFTLADGSVVLLIFSHEALTDDQNRTVDEALAKALWLASGAELNAADSPRGLLIGKNDEGGDRLVWDCAIRMTGDVYTTDSDPSPNASQ
jgi:hypothetical protein